ncbi:MULTISPECIES: AMP-binding protein [unclassified Massilia]|uniref:AMP-binding protein n=1 Tax=unclassified Massilia TaxID=2609279 RepID=UPI001784124A|nr:MULTISPECIES: AMP-binding protein [unclassified Massilia]MBD8528497.1 AMP-binding protein [Massilia sp. CFBP 13647]MBD8671880.1 AMP-binding protein [Massilia sp. CFBP 13721]
MAQLAHELVDAAALWSPTATAVRHGTERISYAGLAGAVAAFGAALAGLGGASGERVALGLPASTAAVVALLGASHAGSASVPLDLRCDAAASLARLRDCGARVLVTDAHGLDALGDVAGSCPALRAIVLHGAGACAPRSTQVPVLAWDSFLASAASSAAPAGGEPGLGALIYGAAADGAGPGERALALSQRNLVAGAASSARCLGIRPGDRVLAALPFASDYGVNILLATLCAGATVVLDTAAASDGLPDPAALARLLERGDITALAALPATWNALAGHDLGRAADCLRYTACAGGGLERDALATLRAALPRTRIHLLYDIGDACRSTSLMPAQLDERPGSIGRALPYSDWLVVRADGRECAPGETGELVRRGALVAPGWWNDPGASSEQFRFLPPGVGLAQRDTGYWPGVSARKDLDGYLYLSEGRNDTITSGGYRISGRELEKIVIGTGLVAEAAAVGVAHPVLGQVIAVLATPPQGARLDSSILFGACRARLPQHMLPAMVDVRRAPLPRARDGQIDRALLAGELAPLFADVAARGAP